MRKVHLTNAEGRDTIVAFESLKPPPAPLMGQPGKPASFRRYLAAGPDGTHEALCARLGADYGKALIEGDPEIDAEQVGRTIGDTMTVLLSHDGQVLHAAPRVVEIILGTEGEEKERRTPVDTNPNVNENLPVRWTRMRFKRADMARRFAIHHSVQIVHVDGLTYDYLQSMAKELDAADEVVLLGAGEKGRDPLIFSPNGTPWRGFLEGRVDGPAYKLLLHLSNLELKRPQTAVGA